MKNATEATAEMARPSAGTVNTDEDREDAKAALGKHEGTVLPMVVDKFRKTNSRGDGWWLRRADLAAGDRVLSGPRFFSLSGGTGGPSGTGNGNPLTLGKVGGFGLYCQTALGIQFLFAGVPNGSKNQRRA